MEIQPARMEQLEVGRGGKLVEIESDVGNVAADLRDIDPGLRLRYSEKGGYFVVYWHPQDALEGDGDLVLTALECDQRIVKRVRQIGSADYDYSKELDRIDRHRDQRLRDEHDNRVGPIAERLYFELRKAQGVKSHAFITRDVPTPDFERPFIGAPEHG